jgi:enoyl-CoA hydratase/carnithine racemase
MAEDLGTPHLRFERDGVFAWCTVDRPEARNALTSAMYYGVRRAIAITNDDAHLEALIITGAGDVFIPGGEMRGRHDDDRRKVAELLGPDVLPFATIRHSRVPVVAAVNGLCQGGGLIIAMLADVAVASDRATFRAPEALRGVADANLAAILPAHVGVARARDMLLTGRRLSAGQALEAGLIARVVPHEELRTRARQAASELLMAGPNARFQCKRMINERYGLVDQMTFESSIGSDEVREGFLAFAEKRLPAWVPEELQPG